MASNGRLSPPSFPSTSKSDMKPEKDMSGLNGETNYDEKFNESFDYVHTSCYLCNGYYGPNFDEPVCTTCHTFLFPEDLSHCISGHAFISEKVDDGDSGNDEPTDLNYCADRRPSENQPIRSLAQKPQPPPIAVPRPDLLNMRLEMLSNPREPDELSSGVVDRLPPEVLLAVFSYLDDISLWSAGKVCKRWSHLLREHVPSEQWRTYTAQRWPLFKPICDVHDWFDVYSDLTDSCPCKTCLQQMAMRMQPPGEENSWRRHRLRNELKYMRTDPPEGIEATPLDPKCCHWQATITGPVGSPYEGGLFYLYLQVPYSYPMCPPIVRFLTRIFHPNVSRHGDVGIDSIQHNWSLALTISKVLISVQSLLTDPFCQVCMEPQLGDLYVNNRAAFEDVARAWTWRYAMHDVVQSPPAVSYANEEGANREERSPPAVSYANEDGANLEEQSPPAVSYANEEGANLEERSQCDGHVDCLLNHAQP